MKLKYAIIIVFSLIFNTQGIAQDDTTNDFNRFDLTLVTGIGYGKVENDNEPNYDLNANVGEAHITYNFSEAFGLSTGLGFLQLSGNGFNSNGNFYHERDPLKIPLMIRSNKNIGDKFSLTISAGFYGQTIINDEYRYLLTTEEDVFGGWTFGFQGYFGFGYEVSDNWTVGLNVSTQSDFNKFETENNVSLNDEQRITTLNTIGLMFGLRF